MRYIATLYNRNFNSGRGSEQLYNEELHRQYKILEHYLDTLLNPLAVNEPNGTMDSSQWFNRENNELKWFDKNNNKWRNFYENKFALIEHLTDILPPSSPLKGQLWIHQGVLCYYDGTTWQPIKALTQDGSQFSLDVFKNFLLTSPLWKIGNTVVLDDDITAYKKAARQYLQGMLDAKNNAKDAIITDANGNTVKWDLTTKTSTESLPEIPELPANLKSQMLVPQLDYARIFLDRTLDSTEYEEVNKTCIQYSKDFIKDKTPSLVHINPGRITKIIKRLIRVDKVNPKIQVSAANTEYYGFKFNSNLGDFLVPDGVDEEGNAGEKDYTIVEDGILLEYHAAQNYDYVLAITYEFSWLKSTGTMNHVSTLDVKNIYYIQDYAGPIAPFVEGLSLENPYFTDDSYNQTISFEEDVTDLEVSFLHVPKREYGYIRYIDVMNRGIIKPLKTYKHPLLFINGEAQYDSYTIDSNGYFYVPNAKIDMAWSVLDLYDAEKDEDLFYKAGYIPKGTTSSDFVSTYTIPKVERSALSCYYNIPATVYAIKFDKNEITDDDNVILFVNGLLLKKEEVYVDHNDGYIYVYTGTQDNEIDIEKYRTDKTYAADIDIKIANGELNGNDLMRDGLSDDCEFIIIKDKYNWLYDESKLMPALGVGSLSDTLVYLNGHLLLSRKESIPYVSASEIGKDIYSNEINNNQIVRQVNTDLTNGIIDENEEYFDYYYYDKDNKKYVYIAQPNEIANIKNITESYKNGLKSISFNIKYSTTDLIDIYAFTTANAEVEQPLVIQNYEIPIGANPQTDFNTPCAFNPNTNSLMVWVDGIRMYPDTDDVAGIIEYANGTGFTLPFPVGGDNYPHYVTVVVEKPEHDASAPCSRTVITEKNIAPNVVNMYSTKYSYDSNGNRLTLTNPVSLYPGRVTIYVNGIRQPEDSYTLHDNYTFSFNDATIIGSNKNYPVQTFADLYGNTFTQTHNQPDYILVEVREDTRQTKTIEINKFPTYEINPTDYDIDMTILEAVDEIMIFINGLYFGAKKNEGYHINLSRGSIMISDQNTCDIINNDEMYNFLTGNSAANQLYLLRHDGAAYQHANAKITLAWR